MAALEAQPMAALEAQPMAALEAQPMAALEAKVEMLVRQTEALAVMAVYKDRMVLDQRPE